MDSILAVGWMLFNGFFFYTVTFLSWYRRKLGTFWTEAKVLLDIEGVNQVRYEALTTLKKKEQAFYFQLLF